MAGGAGTSGRRCTTGPGAAMTAGSGGGGLVVAGRRRRPTTLAALLCLVLFTTETHQYGIQEYCEGETFEAKCKRDEVIVMKSAYYGRMRLGRCVRMNMGYIGCEEDVLDLADQRCSGRNECKIKVPDTNFERTQPCFELKSYLEIEYSCMKVATARPQVCQTAKYVKLTSQSAYLASSVTQSTGCGSSSCPWVIEVPAGQRINLTLADFGWRSRQTSLTGDSVMDSLQVCQKYAVLRELGTTKSITICGSAERQSAIYVSESNQVELYLTPKMASDGSTMHFLLKYEAIGCPDLTPPKNAFVRRHQDGTATVQCKYSGQNWKVKCRGMQWYGTVGNCTRWVSRQAGYSAAGARLSYTDQVLHFLSMLSFSQLIQNPIRTPPNAHTQDSPHRSGRFVIGNVSMPHGIAFAIVAGVAIVIGALILTVGLVIFKRHRRKYEGATRTPLRPGPSGMSGGGGSERGDPRCLPADDYLPPPPGVDSSDVGPTSPLSKYPTTGRRHHGGAPPPPPPHKNEYTHIWEMPLPMPNEANITVPASVPAPVTCP